MFTGPVGDEAGESLDDLIAGALRGPLADDGADLGGVLLAALVAGVALVLAELGAADDVAEQAPVLVGRRGDGDLAVFGVEDVEGAEEGVGVADGAGVLAAVGVEVDVVLAEAEDGVVHRHVEELALAGLAGVEDGGEDADGCQRAGHDVADARAAAEAAGLGRAGDADEAAHRLGDDVVSGQVGVGAGAGARIAEAADGGVDEAWVALGERFVGEAEALHDAGGEVLDEHVRLFGQAHDRLFAAGRLEVEHEAALVAVEAGVIAAEGALGVVVGEGAGEAGHLAAGRLDLDDVGAEVGEEHRAVGAGEGLGEVEDADAWRGGRCGGWSCGMVSAPTDVVG